MKPQQADFFFTEPQGDLFGENEAPAVEIKPDPDRMRRRLNGILTEARAAERMPWTRSKEKLYRFMVPQLSLGLPEDEAAQFRFEFERELERLLAA